MDSYGSGVFVIAWGIDCGCNVSTGILVSGVCGVILILVVLCVRSSEFKACQSVRSVIYHMSVKFIIV